MNMVTDGIHHGSTGRQSLLPTLYRAYVGALSLFGKNERSVAGVALVVGAVITPCSRFQRKSAGVTETARLNLDLEQYYTFFSQSKKQLIFLSEL